MQPLVISAKIQFVETPSRPGFLTPAARGQKNARQALKENVFLQILCFYHYKSNLGGIGNARRGMWQLCSGDLCSDAGNLFDLHPPPGRELSTRLKTNRLLRAIVACARG